MTSSNVLDAVRVLRALVRSGSQSKQTGSFAQSSTNASITESFELIMLTKEVLGDNAYYILEDSEVEVKFFEGRPVTIELPIFVVLTVTDTEPGLRGATVSASPKAATLETGLVIKVPQFIEIGDKVKVDTRDGTFSERA